MLNYDTKKNFTDYDDYDDTLVIVNMAQREAAPIPGANRELHPSITCCKCKKMGHYANNYQEQETQVLQLALPS